jgi:NAD(P)-dependent dehydrogenase (short-subunit alcohol dehydrogenase family)
LEEIDLNIMDRFKLSGKKAFVTGSARGIGRGIAHAFAQAGADLAIVDIDLDNAKKVAEEIVKYNVKSIAIQADVSKSDDVEKMLDKILKEFGTIDIAFNNAGINNTEKAEDVSIDNWTKVLAVNITGVFLTARAAGRVMIEKKKGSIINMGSMSGHVVCHPQTQSAYNSSKAAVIQLTKSLASEWSQYNVRVNSISPGYTWTEMVEEYPRELIAEWSKDIPLGRLCRIEELQGAAVFLASDASSYITGTDLLVDGGFTIW